MSKELSFPIFRDRVGNRFIAKHLAYREGMTIQEVAECASMEIHIRMATGSETEDEFFKLPLGDDGMVRMPGEQLLAIVKVPGCEDVEALFFAGPVFDKQKERQARGDAPKEGEMVQFNGDPLTPENMPLEAWHTVFLDSEGNTFLVQEWWHPGEGKEGRDKLLGAKEQAFCITMGLQAEKLTDEGLPVMRKIDVGPWTGDTSHTLMPHVSMPIQFGRERITIMFLSGPTYDKHKPAVDRYVAELEAKHGKPIAELTPEDIGLDRVAQGVPADEYLGQVH